MNKIPKIVHFYWGNKNLPFLRYLTLFSFRKYNPDWKIKLYFPKVLTENLSWVSSEHKFEPPEGDYIDKIQSLGIEQIEFDMTTLGWDNGLSEVIKSDIIRWHLLSTEGGLWSDSDILYFKPMSHIQADNAEAFVSFVRDHWTVGFMAATQNNLLFAAVNNQTKINFDIKKYQGVGSQLLFRLAGSVDALRKKFNNVTISNLSPNVVYPLPSGKVPLIYSSNDMSLISDETIGLHWYAGRKSTNEAMRSINEQTYKQQNNIMCILIKRVLG